MIKSSDIFHCINDKSADLSKEELERIIDEELEKPEDIMDADLIEYCLDALNEQVSDECRYVEKEKVGDANSKRIARRFRKVIAVAAVAALLFAGVVSVSALVFKANFFDSIVGFYDDRIRIRFNNSDDKADGYKLLGSELAKELADNGISPVLLPEAILTDECKVTSVAYEKLDGFVLASICYVQNGKDAYLTIAQYDSESVVPYKDYLHSSEKTEVIKAANIAVYITEQNGMGTIIYQDHLSVYYIATPLPFEEAVEFAKTIK